MIETKEDLRTKIKELKNKIKELEKTLNTRISIIVDKDLEIDKLNRRIKELEQEKKEQKDDIEYISWLHLNYKHLSRFIQENVNVCTEVEHDYYGNSYDPTSTIEVQIPSEL